MLVRLAMLLAAAEAFVASPQMAPRVGAQVRPRRHSQRPGPPARGAPAPSGRFSASARGWGTGPRGGLLACWGGRTAAELPSEPACPTPRQARAPLVSMASAGGFVPDMERRNVMNLVLVAGAALPVGWLGGGFIYFLVPPGGGGGGGGLLAKDALGNEVNVAKWIKDVPYPSRKLVEGLKGDAHYLIVKEDNTLADFAINAVCTHLGCVVPWNRAANKYICPCHGSQYDFTGKVIRGPAPLSLALAHADTPDDIVTLTPWTETDFRTDTKPWWK